MNSRLLSLCVPLTLWAAPVLAAAEEVHGEHHEDPGLAETAGHAAATAAAHASGHGGEHGGGGGLPQFEPTWFASQIFWLVVVFIILYVIFSKKSLPVISDVLESRRDHIQGDLDTADHLTKEADEVQQAYEQGLDKARVKASEIITDAEAAMSLKSSRALESFAQRTEKDISTTEARIDKAEKDVIHKIDDIASEVAVDIALKIVSGAKFDQKKALDIVEKIRKEERTKAA